MEKLIELLNEYKKIKGYDGDTKIISYNTNTLSFTNGYSLLDYEIVIGKRYGFIKWLVDNDKIDRDKLEKKVLKEDLIRKFDEGLIMLLSISDHPIEDLCKLLK